MITLQLKFRAYVFCVSLLCFFRQSRSDENFMEDFFGGGNDNGFHMQHAVPLTPIGVALYPTGTHLGPMPPHLINPKVPLHAQLPFHSQTYQQTVERSMIPKGLLTGKAPLIPGKPKKFKMGQKDRFPFMPPLQMNVPGLVSHGPVGKGQRPLDIIFVVDSSKSTAVKDKFGRLTWHPAIKDFLMKFVAKAPAGVKYRVGAVAVSTEIDDMIPLTGNPNFFMDMIAGMRPRFRGICMDKGIGVAINLFNQYSRPDAIKRVILLTDGPSKYPHRTLYEAKIATRLGIDLIGVGFGPALKNELKMLTPGATWQVPSPELLLSLVPPVRKRAFEVPVFGGWSVWSKWSPCTATCNLGVQWRFRVCDNPAPRLGGAYCVGPQREEKLCDIPRCSKIEFSLWTFWSKWTPCSVNCGLGTQTRIRSCVSYGGRPSRGCRGQYVESRECTVNKCPVDGGWSHWTDWSLCSASCGDGVKVRARSCDNPVPLNGGRSCFGMSIQEKHCSERKSCPIHGGWALWTEWSGCIGKCGTGFMERKRVCSMPVPQFGGLMCEGPAEEHQECQTKIPCPINGGWSEWSKFSQCSVSCGRGKEERLRLCNNPAPRFGGRDCEGYRIEERECETHKHCPIHGGWGEWSKFSQCSVTCGKGTVKRLRACNNPTPMYGGDDCVGLPFDEQECYANKYCPIHGGWSEWSQFSKCPVKCGSAVVTRMRKCNNPPPQFGGRFCDGDMVEEKLCDTGRNCPIDGGWSLWTGWTKCSVTCGKGVAHRYRSCNNPLPMYSGATCIGDPMEETICNTRVSCAIHGGWSQWSDFDSCSVTCGKGYTTRVRTCTNPVPKNGGDYCFGDASEKMWCNTEVFCPINGNWAPWTHWDSCSVTCGVGVMMRYRDCSNPTPQYGGFSCVGNAIEKMKCDAGVPCAIDGHWSPWSVWNECSKSCSGGIRQRSRSCTNPEPKYGGLQCKGFEIEEVDCNAEIPCKIDGGWSNWSEFLSCSVTCGEGTMIRKRQCNSPEPMYGGLPCEGLLTEENICVTGRNCPINGEWGSWSHYGICSATCGKGVSSRMRMCNNPAPDYGGYDCEGPDIENDECDSGVFCPIDGQWGSWSHFSECSVTCGTGTVFRKRECNSPSPSYGGRDCFGAFTEEEVCNTNVKCIIIGQWSSWGDYLPCSETCGIGTTQRVRNCMNGECYGDPIEISDCDTGVSCPINGNWSPWSEFSGCSVTCGDNGIKTATRKCNNPPPQFGGLDCIGPAVNEAKCGVDVFCPIHGGWTPWHEWARCSVTCGTGNTYRYRECKNPAPMFGGEYCKGPDEEKSVCDTSIYCPIHGGWSTWTEWSHCSKLCGVGVSQRSRECNKPMPQYAGMDCKGEYIQNRKCEIVRHCPIDGGFSEWSAWSGCYGKCGLGMKKRSRVCNNPVSMYGGRKCDGLFFEEVSCNTGINCPVHGQWGLWGEWSVCSSSCGEGTKERSRACDAPVPLYGGHECVGDYIDIQKCDFGIPCPVDGGWTLWMDWTACSVSCGSGIVTRQRFCSNPAPVFGGRECKGPNSQQKVCEKDKYCPVDGHWSKWSEWGACSRTCGLGSSIRIRNCNSPAPQYGGLPCQGFAQDEMPCEEKAHCPIPGGWSQWSNWGYCSVSCGVGFHKSVRGCTNPNPQYGGAYCEGVDTKSESCSTGLDCPIDGGWSAWGKWEICSASCGIGTQSRSRKCSNPPPQNGGLFCEGYEREKQDCDSGMHCPIDGRWSLWTAWSKCDVSCGLGTRIRKRTCTNPAPKYGGMMCEGDNAEKRKCDSGVYCPVDGHWLQWSQWSTCSETCGIGLTKRVRQCIPPQYGGVPCEGFDSEISDCNTHQPCPIDGYWSGWKKWSKCSVTCGIGFRTRYRECNDPPPEYGGNKCVGANKDIEDCDTGMNCPIDGHWTEWSLWSLCSASCGIGTEIRIRECSNPPPQYGGTQCKGYSEEKRNCERKTPCPIDGVWSAWGGWSRCDVPCGYGKEIRTRECADPPAQYGGIPCHGSNREKRKCDTGVSCPVAGGWTYWSAWSMCSVTCGLGQQSRVRQCSNPVPVFGGKFCSGKAKEVRDCDTKKYCPVNGKWSVWSEFTLCSATCGTGMRTRQRECINPPPQFGGLFCEGKGFEEEKCDTNVICPINGHWGDWKGWSKCSVTCGYGLTYRKRFCESPPPAYGGMNCQGSDKGEKQCRTGINCPVDGSWSKWSEWLGCDVPCGIGKTKRYRLCTSPEPKFGGQFCHGDAEDTSLCDTGIICAINGQWSLWMGWSACSVTCGIGISNRVRDCNNPAPKNGGLNCEGNAEEVKECNTHTHCPVDGAWSWWMEWNPCSATCGAGIQIRRRHCDSPQAKFGGRNCLGHDVEERKCVSDRNCPVDGMWSMWSEWAKCSATCGTGLKKRIRLCNSPPPKFGGALCKGFDTEETICTMDIKCRIDGKWSLWSAWSICSAKCGKGIKIRSRSCDSPPPQYGGALCVGSERDEMLCVADAKCAIDGGWSWWGLWSKCSTTCGAGLKMRHRVCDNPMPQYGGKQCMGDKQEKVICNTDIACPIHGGWSLWGDWSYCSPECGPGTQQRVRECNQPIPLNGGRPCEGNFIQERPCFKKEHCAIHGAWSFWSEWTRCSVTCGDGVTTRSRICNNPAPQYGGMPCRGDSKELGVCSTGQGCPVPGHWSGWLGWQRCDCTTLEQIRKRTCSQPFPIDGGLGCEGFEKDIRKCNKHDLDRDCPVWSDWSVWSKCADSCGPSVKTRQRTCYHPFSKVESQLCKGPAIETLPCMLSVCPERPINCSTDCEWENGIGYSEYPGDCSLFVQCDSFHGEPKVQRCAYGLLWSQMMLQCVYPEQAECPMCTKRDDGKMIPYYISCRSYWECQHGVPHAECCPKGQRFEYRHGCVPDIEGICIEDCPPRDVYVEIKCTFRKSSKGPTYYEEMINGQWTPRPCSIGTHFDTKTCQCQISEGLTLEVCKPSLNLQFNSLDEDLHANEGVQINYVKYLGDGTALFDGKANIVSNIFANSEWGHNVYVYLRFKPTGTKRMQGLVHNSGCGSKDIGPSVFMGIDRDPAKYGNNINFKFSTVPQTRGVDYRFINITTKDHVFKDVWLAFENGKFTADVDGFQAVLELPGNRVARRHGAINIGGNLCRIGNEAFGGFHGIIDEVRIYKCIPPGQEKPQLIG